MERPILFSGPMVRAILEGRKTQTRRVVKEAIDRRTNEQAGAVHADGSGKGYVAWFPGTGMTAEKTVRAYPGEDGFKCPYGQPGDRLWVREAFGYERCGHAMHVLHYRADDRLTGDDGYQWKPSIHMPRWASRITLEFTGVRVERLQEISEEDAKAEGARWHDFGRCGSGAPLAGWSMENPFPDHFAKCLNTARMAFGNFINKLHGGDNWNIKPTNLWDENPWVWVIEFSKI